MERRGEPIDTSLVRLCAAAEARADESVQAIADALVDEVPGPGPEDDIVALVFRAT